MIGLRGRRALHGVSVVALIGACAGIAPAAWARGGNGPVVPAQDMPQSALIDPGQDAGTTADAVDDGGSAGAGGGQEIVVTGSRVIRDGSGAPTPLTVVASEQLELAAPANLADGLNQLPAFRGSARPQTAGALGGGLQSAGGNYLNLRNLGMQRTLVLLDGRRAPPNATSGATDVNLLPQLLVQRVDTVTGGASAAYGSDAVAGVVNFVLDTDFTGLKGVAQAGVSSRGDNGSQRLALAGGTSFADGRGHILLSAEYARNDPISDYNGRDWAEAGGAIIPNMGAGASSIIATDVNISIATLGGRINAVRRPDGTTIANDPITAYQFGTDGSLEVFELGTNRTGQVQIGGDGARQSTSLVAGLERTSLFGRMSYEVADDVTFFAEGNYGRSRSVFKILPPFNYNSSAFNIFPENAYMPDDLRAMITARNTDADPTNDIGSLSVGRLNADFGDITSDTVTRTWRGLAGFEARVADGWAMDGYYSHAESRVRQIYHNNPIFSRLAAALDAVEDGNGNIVCRAQPGPQGPDGIVSPTCVPINIFGYGAPSQEALDYVLGDTRSDLVYKQDVAALSFSGSPFSTWAGEVGLGFGVEWRRESADVTVDPLSTAPLNYTGLRGLTYQPQNGNYQVGNPQPISGSNSVKEAFLEVAVPLMRGSRFGHMFDLSGAVRYADYEYGGGVTTWKIGAVYEPVQGLRLRATRSRDIRAANIGELFGVGTQSQGAVRLPDGSTMSYVGLSGGNPDLVPETADTFTAGVVVQPRFLPGFTATVDYYNIDIDGVIGTLTAQQTYDQCMAGSSLACANIEYTPGRITISTKQLNLNRLQTRGVDVELGWHGDALGGQVDARLLVGYLDRYILSVPGAAPIDYTGEVGQVYANPKWTGTVSLNYRRGAMGLFVQERYIHHGIYNATLVEGVTVNDNSIPARWYTDVTLTYSLDDVAGRPEMFLTINNLFDQDPPLAPLPQGTIYRLTNPALYDVVGRYMTAGVRVRF